MKPTEHTANTASTPKTGLIATLRARLRAQGSSAPLRKLIATPLITFCALFTLSAAVARAEAPRLVSFGSFPAFNPAGVAVDNSSNPLDKDKGDVYVAGILAGKINKFDASGNLLSPPSPFGEGSDYSGAAVNPTTGDVYVLNAATSEIGTYDPSSGALLSSFSVPESANLLSFLSVVQIATDSAGDVYVPVVPENKILEYDPATCPASPTLCPPLKTFTGSGASALKEPSGVAVDSSGDVWVADTGNHRIEELSSTGAFVGRIKSEGVGAVALDSHGDVLAIVKNEADACGAVAPPCAHLVEYDSAGTQIADVGAASFETGDEGFHVMPTVAVDEASGRVYVTDVSNQKVWIFAPPTAPTVAKELTAEVTTFEAKLGALVNPGGIATSYRFEYGTTTAYGQSTPFPEGSVGEGFSAHTVWAAASSLASNTTYHYRVVATNELGTVAGPDQTFTTQTAEQAACPNEQLRGGFSARLADCRAYELLAPPVKNSAAVNEEESAARANDGNAIQLHFQEPLPEAPSGGNTYVATRGASGWKLEDIMPLESNTGVLCYVFKNVPTYSEELSKEVMVTGEQSSASPPFVGNAEACNAEGIQVASGEPLGYENLVVRDNATGAYQLINTPPPGVTPAAAHFQASSADLSHVIFTETSPLARDAQYGVENLYEWDEGALRLVSVLPNGTAVLGSLPGEANTLARRDSVSAEGSHIVFTSGGDLYVRIDGEHTVQLDESQRGAGPSGGGSFVAASANGSMAFFLDDSKLTPASTAEIGEPDLYECVLPDGAGKCELTDLTVANAGEHANVLRLMDLGKDASFVYFTATGVLANNKHEHTDAEGKTVVEGAESGQDNLYVSHEGTTTFIATGKPGAGAFETNGIPGQASPDGTWFAFASDKSLTGYDNNVGTTSGPVEELFLYSASTNQLFCASCDPSGEAPILGGGVLIQSTRRHLTDGGHVFFETDEALVPADTNGQQDVYEYENGEARLISSGTSSSKSFLLGVSESGNDVFFGSSQRLVPHDTQEGMFAVYDARVDGGFPESVSPPACTTADACREAPAPQPSIYGEPPSATFSGAGNLTPSAAKPKTKPKAKPVKCKTGFAKNKKGKCVHKKTRKTSNKRRAK